MFIIARIREIGIPWLFVLAFQGGKRSRVDDYSAGPKTTLRRKKEEETKPREGVAEGYCHGLDYVRCHVTSTILTPPRRRHRQHNVTLHTHRTGPYRVAQIKAAGAAESQGQPSYLALRLNSMGRLAVSVVCRLSWGVAFSCGQTVLADVPTCAVMCRLGLC